MATMTQNERILDYLGSHDHMTGDTAQRELGILCYTKRISELRREGHNIVSTRVPHVDRFGCRTQIVEYRLEES